MAKFLVDSKISLDARWPLEACKEIRGASRKGEIPETLHPLNPEPYTPPPPSFWGKGCSTSEPRWGFKPGG